MFSKMKIKLILLSYNLCLLSQRHVDTYKIVHVLLTLFNHLYMEIWKTGKKMREMLTEGGRSRVDLQF